MELFESTWIIPVIMGILCLFAIAGANHFRSRNPLLALILVLAALTLGLGVLVGIAAPI